jgi:hypothetical protein
LILIEISNALEQQSTNKAKQEREKQQQVNKTNNVIRIL